MDYRTVLLQGKLPLPSEDQFAHRYPSEIANIRRMWKALWHNYLQNEGPINTTNWYDQFTNPDIFNKVLMSLSKGHWIESEAIPERNWAEARLLETRLLEFVTKDELMQIRADYKFSMYQLELKASQVTKGTRLNGKVQDTGLTRVGFCDAGNTQFGYDTVMLNKYRVPVQLNLTKSMDKIKDLHPSMVSNQATYDTVSIAVLDYHLNNPTALFTTGNSFNDSRGRAISNALRKVANPISCKDFRSALVLTYD